MGRLTKQVVMGLSLVVFAYLGLGHVLLGGSPENPTYRSLGVFSEVLQHIQQDWVEEPSLPMVTLGALHGLLEALDPYSSYMSPGEYGEYKKRTQNGAKGQVGAVLSKRLGFVTVVSVLPNSPAQKAGLRHGDWLETLGGFSTREMSVYQAYVLLGGEPGTSIRVSVVRRSRGEPQEVDITRATIEPLRVLAEKLADGEGGGLAGYLRIYSLKPGRADEIREKLSQFQREGIRKLVLDLRECASGEVSEAVAVARLFLGSGKITTLRGQTVEAQEFSADGAKPVWTYPMVVLIAGSTSGASEVLAAALAENGRARTVGSRTFGSASEQKLFPLEDGAALFLTVAHYYTPSGKVILEEGITPGVEVVEQDDGSEPEETTQPATSNDPVVKKAMEVLRGSGVSQSPRAALRKARPAAPSPA